MKIAQFKLDYDLSAEEIASMSIKDIKEMDEDITEKQAKVILTKAKAEVKLNEEAEASIGESSDAPVIISLTAEHGLQGEAPTEVSINNFPTNIEQGKKYIVSEAITGRILNPMSGSGASNGWMSVTLSLDNGEKLNVALTVNGGQIGQKVTVEGAVFSYDVYQGKGSLSGIATYAPSLETADF